MFIIVFGALVPSPFPLLCVPFVFARLENESIRIALAKNVENFYLNSIYSQMLWPMPFQGRESRTDVSIAIFEMNVDSEGNIKQDGICLGTIWIIFKSNNQIASSLTVRRAPTVLVVNWRN